METIRDARGRFIAESRGHLGYKHSEATKQRMSRAKCGVPVGDRNPRWNPKRHSTEQVACACGCGTMIAKYDYRGRVKEYVVGHTMKGRTRVFTPEWLGRIQQAAVENGKKMRGSNHWNWKGGISGNHRRETLEYKRWRLAVYERDRWHCQDCGRHCDRRDIVAHHIKSFKDYPELRYDVGNGVTLCRKCHLRTERGVANAN